MSENSYKHKSERDLYFSEALKYLPHILTLLDHSPLSPTYGCFDRSYWHYKTADFPSGMYQENVLPLALVYVTRFPGNIYYKLPSIRELATAGMHFAMKSSHDDGSCDDYYPNERALGATVFSLLAMTEAYELLKLNDKELVSFFAKRAKWLMNHQETGKLSNHQALVALALYNTFTITRDRKYLEGVRERFRLLFSWQHPEGWFQEYEGADPGYQTVTIDALSRYWMKSGDSSVLPFLKKALKFCVYFLHPDGSYGGEYGSRNTFIAYPAGMEILSEQFDEASYLARGFLKGISRGTRLFLDDDRMVGHLVSNYLLAYRYYRREKAIPHNLPEEFVKHFVGCQIAIVKKKALHMVIALNKGGAYKIYKDNELKANSTGLAIEFEDGKTGATNHISDNKVKVGSNGVKVEGYFIAYRKEYASPLKLIIFRVLTMLVGRSFRGSQFIRKLLQKRLITHRELLPVRFLREIRFNEQEIIVSDKINKETKMKISRLIETTNLTSIYVAQSNAYQVGRLMMSHELTEERKTLNKTGSVVIQRLIK